jgi:DNA repair photolyase
MSISRSNLWKKRLGDYVVNPYVGCEHGCYHCYCPAMPGVKFFNGGHSQQEWGKYLYPKNGFLPKLQTAIRRHKNSGSPWGQGKVLMSFLTDCYTPAESQHQLTRQALIMMLEAGLQVRVQTRSGLVERDIDILRSHRDQVIVGTSIPYLDDRLARVLEPKASSPSRRMKMLAKMFENDIPVYLAVAPFLPFHGEDDLEEIISSVAAFSPTEVFDEVVNPMDDNLGMMNRALIAANRTERIEDYRDDWPRFTVDHLRNFLHVCEKYGVNGIAWPSPKLANSKVLAETDRQFLKEWLPSPGDGNLASQGMIFDQGFL